MWLKLNRKKHPSAIREDAPVPFAIRADAILMVERAVLFCQVYDTSEKRITEQDVFGSKLTLLNFREIEVFETPDIIDGLLFPSK